jgi:hypothetical protein
MTVVTLEVAKIRLRAHASEADLLGASERFQHDFLDKQPGFIRRELLRLDDGNYLDLVHWRNAADAASVLQRTADSPSARAYFSLMETDPGKPAITHYASLATYGRDILLEPIKKIECM